MLIEGLRRLEYRGYDSAGVAVQADNAILERVRTVGKVDELARALDKAPINGRTGIAHTRWATHGVPSEKNAHPHLCHECVALVHNGIIENHVALRTSQEQAGYRFTSETDTEVIPHLLEEEEGVALDEAVRRAGSAEFGMLAAGLEMALERCATPPPNPQQIGAES